MKRFVDYFVLREADGTEAVKGQFEQLRNQIGSMFQVLYRAAQKTWGKAAPALGEKVKAEVIADLEGVLAKLKGGATAPMRAECFRIANDITNSLNEADDIVSGLRPTAAAGATGRPVYNMMDVLKNIENKIMQGVAGLEQSVLGQKIDAMHADLGGKSDALGGKLDNQGAKLGSLGGKLDAQGKSIGGLGSKMDKHHQDLSTDLQGVGSDVRRVRGQVSGLDDKLGAASDDIRGDVAKYGQKTLGGLDGLDKKADKLQGGLGNGIDPAKHDDIVSRLDRVEKNTASPTQPLGTDREDSADASIGTFRQLARMGGEHGFKIIHPNTGDTLDAATIRKAGRSTLLGLARRDANFQVTWDGLARPIPFHIGDANNAEEIAEKFYTDKKIDPNAYANADKKFATKGFGTRHAGEAEAFGLDGKKITYGGAGSEKGKKAKDVYASMKAARQSEYERRLANAREKGWPEPTLASIPVEDLLPAMADDLKKQVLDLHYSETGEPRPKKERVSKPKKTAAKKKVAPPSSEEVREWLGLNVPEK